MAHEDAFVIVGGGQAGAWVARSLRSEGFAGPVLLFGEEQHWPYERPPLSKSALVSGSADEGVLLTPEQADLLGIDVRLGQRVITIDRTAHELVCADGARQRYARLFLTIKLPPWASERAAGSETPDYIRNSPALKGVEIPRTGQTGFNIGTLLTKGLVIAGDAQVTTTPDHPRGAMLRAYDQKTGKEVGSVLMPAGQSGSPMTYMVNGKQYIVVAVSGGDYSGEYIAYTLPDGQ